MFSKCSFFYSDVDIFQIFAYVIFCVSKRNRFSTCLLLNIFVQPTGHARRYSSINNYQFITHLLLTIKLTVIFLLSMQQF